MLGIRISSPATNHGASAKEYDGGRTGTAQVVTEEMAANVGFGDVHLRRSLSPRFRAVSAHFCGRPLPMANLESFDFFGFLIYDLIYLVILPEFLFIYDLIYFIILPK